MCKANTPAVMDMVRTLERNISLDVSIGLLRDHIGCRSLILAPILP